MGLHEGGFAGMVGAEFPAACSSVQRQSAAERPSGWMLLTAALGQRRTRTR